MASTHWTAIMFVALSLWPADPVGAQPPVDPTGVQPPAARRGLRFVALHCAQCHAIDKDSASPVAKAPPFRTLHLKYPVADLQRPLAEGVHPTMPVFRLEPHQVEDVMAYLRTLEP